VGSGSGSAGRVRLGAALVTSVLTLLYAARKEMGWLGCTGGWGRPVSAGPRGCGRRDAAAGPDSVSSRVLAQYRIGIRKILFFSNLFIICKLI
jgi:hypothetical protein